MLRHAAEHWGDRDFVVMPDRRLTYADAEAASRPAGARHARGGMGKGTRVGLFFTYGQDWVVAWLAASRIGALVMPLATTYRPAEIRKVLRIGDVHTAAHRALVLGTRHAGDARGQRARAGRRDRSAPLPPRRRRPCARSGSPAAPTGLGHPASTSTRRVARRRPVYRRVLRAVEAEVVPADLAQVTYTSGSSADPKGVVHTHGTVVRATACLAALQTAGDGPAAFFCAFPFFWIGGTLILGAALQRGATVLCTERFDPGAALDLIERSRPRTWSAGRRSSSRCATTRRSPTARPARDRRASPSAPPTSPRGEPGPRHPRAPRHERDRRQLASVEHQAVDPETGEDVPDSEEGELLVRGFGLMHGYYKQERDEVFDDDGWFHTGDRVFLYDGRPYFVGRSPRW